MSNHMAANQRCSNPMSQRFKSIRIVSRNCSDAVFARARRALRPAGSGNVRHSVLAEEITVLLTHPRATARAIRAIARAPHGLFREKSPTCMREMPTRATDLVRAAQIRDRTLRDQALAALGGGAGSQVFRLVHQRYMALTHPRASEAHIKSLQTGSCAPSPPGCRALLRAAGACIGSPSTS